MTELLGAAGAARARLGRRRRRASRASVVMLENCRFNKGEKKNDDALAKKMAALCDIYVNDAFGTAHRAEARPTASPSTRRSPAPARCWRPNSMRWARRCAHPARPLVAIVAGSKVSTKLTMLEVAGGKSRPADRRRRHRQHLHAGGRVSDRQIAVRNPNWCGEAQAIMDDMKARGGAGADCRSTWWWPSELSARAARQPRRASTEVGADDMILDIGPQTAAEARRASSRAPAPSSGTGRSAYSNSTSSARAPS